MLSPTTSRSTQACRVAAVFLCVVAAGIGVLGLTATPDLTNRLRDDAYYEFTWAANVVAGRGPAVSDGVTTSGVQWLWTLLLVPFAWLLGPAALPLVAPWLGLLMHVVAAWLWWASARTRWVGWCLGGLWLGNPLLVRECQNGQETALAALCATALWLGRHGSARRWQALVLAATLARTDLFVLAALLSWWRGRHGRTRNWFAPSVALGAVTLGNVALGGGVLQDSALPMAWLWHANQMLVDPSFTAWLRVQWWYARPLLLGGPFALVAPVGVAAAVAALLRAAVPWRWRVLPMIAVAAMACGGAADCAVAGGSALLACASARPSRRSWRLRVDAHLLLAFGLAAIVALHWAVRWYPRDYYLAPLAVLGVAALGRWARHRTGALLLVGAAVVQGIAATSFASEPLAGQRELELAGRTLAHVLPNGQRVGCFNSGIVTFTADVLAESTQRRGVVNLDGVVDARALRALQQRSLAAWLDAEGIAFVVDNAVQFHGDPRVAHACGPWFAPDFHAERDLVEVARFDVPGIATAWPEGDSVRLYWRVGRGQRPSALADARELPPMPDGDRVVAWPARAGQRLHATAGDGSRHRLVHATVDTVVVTTVPAALSAPVRLFVDDEPVPVLELRL